ncbi:DUF2285 domain-containing protein [Sphingopyxis sp. 113P3]|uniref:DUF2285 domain-containing protein n=1 Tax=Sphingopyxis sp. (strain 113P3) TaxID=292913 RepID=UPI0006BCC58C|nr:DUF2285 domain-containing protein [Sphingopyxis sp. 113P3]ALC11405.1 hypothetical protein LH20_05500 [Sphingopyxis sp. 113P3]
MDPQAPSSEARIVWLPANDTSAVFLGPAPAGLAEDTDPQPTFDAAYRIGDHDEDILLYDLGDGQSVQLVIETATPVDRPLAAIIPLGRDGFDRVRSLCRLLATLHGRAIPPDTRLTAQHRLRLRRMLQCFDGYRNGATQREIAQVIFHIARLDRQAWQDASARHAIKTLLRDARAMIAGGYRALLRHRRSD